MGLFKYLFSPHRHSASVAKERLKIVLAHERAGRDAPDFLPKLQKELIDVVGRYVEIRDDMIRVNLGKARRDLAARDQYRDRRRQAARDAGDREKPVDRRRRAGLSAAPRCGSAVPTPIGQRIRPLAVSGACGRPVRGAGATESAHRDCSCFAAALHAAQTPEPSRRSCAARSVRGCCNPVRNKPVGINLSGIPGARVRRDEGTMNDVSPITEGKALAQGPGALAGLKVIDLTRVLGGPYCTMVLSDHGADVIKLEPPQGDETREWGPPFDEAGDASYYLGINRNKQGVGLDLSKPAGREVLLRLLDGADVLVENFKPGSMERWGLGYEEVLSKRFPRLIHCRVSGFGGDGPLGGFPGYDAVLQAMVGLMSINGTETSGPTRLGNPIVDIATGLFSAIAILMALYEREKSGRGQYCDMTLHDCGMALLHPHAANFFLSGKGRARPATRIRTSRPIRSFRPAPARFSSPPATTRRSVNSASFSACRSWRAIRVSRPMPGASSIATR